MFQGTRGGKDGAGIVAVHTQAILRLFVSFSMQRSGQMLS